MRCVAMRTTENKTSAKSTGARDRVRWPWAIGPPNGPVLAAQHESTGDDRCCSFGFTPVYSRLFPAITQVF